MMRGPDRRPDEAPGRGHADAFVGYTELRRPASSPTGRADPRDDLMSVLVHAEVDGDRLDDDAARPRVAAHPHRRRRDDPPRHHRRRRTSCCADRDQLGARCVADPALLPDARSRRCCAGSSPIKNMARTATRDVELGGQQHPGRARSCCCSTRRPTATRTCSPTRSRFDIDRTPERPRRLRLRHPLLPRATASPGSSCRVMFEQLLDRLPDLELVDADRARPTGRPTSSAATSRCPCASPPSPSVGALTRAMRSGCANLGLGDLARPSGSRPCRPVSAGPGRRRRGASGSL